MITRFLILAFVLVAAACSGGNTVLTSPSPTTSTSPTSPTSAPTPPASSVSIIGSAIDATTGLLVGGLTNILVMDGPNEGKSVSFRGNFTLAGLQPGTFTVKVTANSDSDANQVPAQPYIPLTQSVTVASSGRQDFRLEQRCYFRIANQFSPTLGYQGTPGQLFRPAGAPPIAVMETQWRIDKRWGGPECRWTFTSSEPWVTLTPSSGTGGSVLPNGPTVSEGGDWATLSILLSPVLFQCAVITVGDHVDPYLYDHYVHIANFGIGAAAAGTPQNSCDPYFEKFPSRRFP